jgi:hypothetical protein
MARKNRRENASRISHAYKVGGKVLLKKPGKHLRKLEASRTGPYTLTAIYNNGTLRVQQGKVNERVNIKRYTEQHRRTELIIPISLVSK